MAMCVARLDPATGIGIYGSNGIAVGDIDNDGADEVYVCQPGGLPNRLYKDMDGKFRDITEQAGVGVLDDTSCGLLLDLRNAGHQDLIVLRSSGPALFLNQGDGTFRLRDDAFRFATLPQGSFTGMAAADYDRDGKLDSIFAVTFSIRPKRNTAIRRLTTTRGTVRRNFCFVTGWTWMAIA